MKTFLEYVAADIIRRYGTELSKTAVVFPNKRAALFMNDYLAREAKRPLWSPKYITISGLFRSQSELIVADPIKLVGDLHKSYAEVTKSNESLDSFYGYGEIMAADFDDIDKSMADAEKVFANVGGLKEMDDTSYLTEEQRDALRRFFGVFKDEDTELKRRFKELWNNLYSIYANYNERLAKQGLAYEGMLYRGVANDERASFDMDRYLFVGFNLLSKVEQRLFDRLKAMGKAKFYWDYDTYYINDSEAGRYIKTFKERYGNELDDENTDIYSRFAESKDITFASASTEDVQARYITHWLKADERRIRQGRRTAVVMCDEQLLTTAIHCFPDEARQINITTGYPLAQMLYGPIASLDDKLRALLSLKITGEKPEEWLDGIISSIERITKDNAWIKEKPLLAEALFRTYKIGNRLKTMADSGDIKVDTPTLKKLMREIVRTTSIPFSGEPAVGIQLMGVLETRNLDFDSVLILSCNEGNMPRGISSSTSFIPYSVRKAYGLTTTDHIVAIYSYYFHRLLQRASDITITYNTSTSTMAKGEMSRYMLAMIAESDLNIKKVTLRAGSENDGISEPKAIDKSKRVMELLRNRFDIERQEAEKGKAPTALLSATAINTYSACQLKFYYKYVACLREPDNDDDTIDGRTFGNIFHDSAKEIYEKMAEGNNSLITKAVIEKVKADEDYLKSVIDKAFRKNYFNIEGDDERKVEYNGLQLINFNVILTYIKKLLDIDGDIAPFNIVGLERDVMKRITVDAGNGMAFATTVGGRIDRMDSVTMTDSDGSNRRLRIIDYKTGAKEIDKKPTSVEDIFEGKGDHPDYYLQAILYADIARETVLSDNDTRTVSPAILFIQKAKVTDYDPTLIIDKLPIADVSTIAPAFDACLKNRINEIFDPATPFTPTDDIEKTCNYCPFIRLCGRRPKEKK